MRPLPAAGCRAAHANIFLTCKEPQKCSPLQRVVIADGPLQHRIPRLKRVEHRSQRDRTLDFKRQVAVNLRERSQMRRKYNSDHDSVCTSTDSTAGRSRTIGFQLSPASADAY